VRTGLDRRRFPWVSEGREPTEEERSGAVLASAALMATGHVGTSRRTVSKAAQEALVQNALEGVGFIKISTRDIGTLSKAPLPGQFSGESMLGERKADFVVGLWDLIGSSPKFRAVADEDKHGCASELHRLDPR
jgi:XamI restriction endonuclease